MGRTKVNGTRPRGRPTKLDPRMRKRIAALARRGLTQKAIGKLLKLSHSTIIEAKRRYPKVCMAFEETLNTGVADVEDALFKRAVGYNFVERREEVEQDGQYRKVRTAKIKRHVPPDVSAQKFYLRNRAKDEWEESEGESGTVVNLHLDKRIAKL